MTSDILYCMTESDQPPHTEKPFEGKIRPLTKEDIPKIKPILETWFKDRNTGEDLPNEVNGVMNDMEDSLSDRNDYVYLIAQAIDGEVTGMIGLRNPSPVMRSFAKTHNPAELVNLYF